MAAIVSIIWAGLLLYLAIRIEANYKAHVALKQPLGTEQYNELVKAISLLQDKVNRLAIARGLENDDE